MLDGRQFNPYEMTGQTEEDCEKIEDAIKSGFSLYVDKHMRVVADSALYIANAIEVKKGKGIIYRKVSMKRMYEEFDPKVMTGQTEKDKQKIKKALDAGKSLYIDDTLTITTESGEIIAKGFIIAPGYGISNEEI